MDSYGQNMMINVFKYVSITCFNDMCSVIFSDLQCFGDRPTGSVPWHPLAIAVARFSAVFSPALLGVLRVRYTTWVKQIHRDQTKTRKAAAGLDSFMGKG